MCEASISASAISRSLTDLPLHQVAAISGFGDQSQLSKHYRRAYGVAPGAERR
jgi:transcriptional regulator GlxA family with amidase domain